MGFFIMCVVIANHISLVRRLIPTNTLADYETRQTKPMPLRRVTNLVSRILGYNYRVLPLVHVDFKYHKHNLISIYDNLHILTYI